MHGEGPCEGERHLRERAQPAVERGAARLDERLVTLDESSVVFSSAEKTSVSYPGLRSAYDFVTVDARVRGLPECDETFVSRFRANDDALCEAEPSFTSTERGADGTTLVATWVWREGHFVDDGT